MLCASSAAGKLGALMSKSSSSSVWGVVGVAAYGLLCMAFVYLKLHHVIDWSWWWLAAPLAGAIAFWLLTMFVVALALLDACD